MTNYNCSPKILEPPLCTNKNTNGIDYITSPTLLAEVTTVELFRFRGYSESKLDLTSNSG